MYARSLWKEILILHSIVAISGLGSHAYGSFKSKNRSDPHMWLRDSLPNFLLQEVSDRPMARVMLYGYDSQVAGSRSLSNLAGLAQHLRESLRTIGSAKPLIFIAHSLGGLIVKEVSFQIAPLARWTLKTVTGNHSLGERQVRGESEASPVDIWRCILRCSPPRYGCHKFTRHV